MVKLNLVLNHERHSIRPLVAWLSGNRHDRAKPGIELGGPQNAGIPVTSSWMERGTSRFRGHRRISDVGATASLRAKCEGPVTS